jgi:hypothetical protein
MSGPDDDQRSPKKRPSLLRLLKNRWFIRIVFYLIWMFFRGD